jgi:hypothetical protein
MLLTVMEDANNSFWQASHPLNYWLYFGVFYDVLSSMVLTVGRLWMIFKLKASRSISLFLKEEDCVFSL